MDGVTIRLCGGFGVSRDGAPVHVGGRTRVLLAVLAASHGRAVGAAELAAVLWPDAPPCRPGNSVAVLVSRLRSALGVGAVGGGRDGYRIGPAVRIDVKDAADLADDARAHLAAARPVAALGAARHGLDLLGDGVPPPTGPDAPWEDDLHAEVAVLLAALRRTAAAAALDAGDPAAAVEPARAAVDADPLDEQALRLLMSAHDAAGERGRALDAYARARATFADELGTEPAETTRALQLAILRGGPAAAAPARRRAGTPRSR